MSLTDISFARALDLQRNSRILAKQLDNTSGGVWEKFYGDAFGDEDWVKAEDYDIFQLSEIAARFDNSKAGANYATALSEKQPAKKAVGAKLESDLLTDMHKAQVMRFTPRIRAVAASLGRRRSLSTSDIGDFYLTFIEKWGAGSDDEGS